MVLFRNKCTGIYLNKTSVYLLKVDTKNQKFYSDIIWKQN